MLEQIADLISQHYEQELSIVNARILSGGSINHVQHITLDNGSEYVLKSRRGPVAETTFQIEYESLLLLAMPGLIRVPIPVLYGDDFLLMEFIRAGEKAQDWQEKLGRQLALLHQHTQQEKFGFSCDNYLGTSIQSNTWQTSWLDFWHSERLQPQLKLFSEQAGVEDPLIKKGNLLLDKLESYLDGITEAAVLLHGDLWSGNAMADQSGEPVIFDPACYYGHREAEFGMMKMFGGFGPRCEAAYAEIWPFQEGYEKRFRLYQLYHELNHLNLFGNTYYEACMSSIKHIL
tara:strand:+ start:22293 stop:23159 length:867 start_codon:yes stop_codon:yes gene_type:complete